ncbi:MAG: discoidin domain-containing protein [Chloroflexota bacterium]
MSLKISLARLWPPLVLAALACNVPGVALTPSSGGAVTTQPAAQQAPAAPTPTPRPPDLNHQPLYWFAPLPVESLPGGTDGATDFLELFSPDAAWHEAAAQVQVFKLYGGWAVRGGTTSEVQQAVQGIRQRGLALAVELGPLNPTEDCGLYVEGFAGDEGIETLERIKRNGGEVNLIALDEPYFWAHFFTGEHACQWPADKIARDVDAFIRRARAVFPNVIVGDIEPVTGPANAQAYKDWLDLFRQVTGYDLAFLHLDIDWADTTWPQTAKAIEDYGRTRNIPVGIIYTGNFQDATSEAWLSIAGERVKRYELESGGQPAHVVFQSWNDKPDRVLPESDPFTFSGFIKTYFENKSALGFRPGANANLALKKAVQVSAAMPGTDGTLAVDGDPGTLWNSGDDAAQWILIDLGQPAAVAKIRLVVTQYPEGLTAHQIWVGADLNALSMVHEFSGFTKESDVLEYMPAAPLTGIRFVKILTAASPSWVAWREIEILGP